MKVVWVIFAIVLLGLIGFASLTEKQFPLSFFGSVELKSPGDWIKPEQVQIYKDKVILNIQNPIWASFANTNSMDPLIDENSNAIEIKPSSPDKVKVGDIISYRTEYGVVIHRVIEQGVDEKGYYYKVKGDNNKFKDPFKVRFSDLEGVVVGIIY